MKRAGILYFTDNDLDPKYAVPVRERIEKIAEELNMELVLSIRPPDEPRGYLTMFKQILRGLQELTTDWVFMAEHDVLYPKEHFEFEPTDLAFYYDHNWYKLHVKDGFIAHWDADQVSGLCAPRKMLIDYYTQVLDSFDAKTFNRKFEPYNGPSKSWKAPVPHIDLRTGQNLTGEKRSLDDFRDKSTAKGFVIVDSIPGWNLSAILK